jgi:hypothetical protein
VGRRRQPVSSRADRLTLLPLLFLIVGLESVLRVNLSVMCRVVAEAVAGGQARSSGWRDVTSIASSTAAAAADAFVQDLL